MRISVSRDNNCVTCGMDNSGDRKVNFTGECGQNCTKIDEYVGNDR